MMKAAVTAVFLVIATVVCAQKPVSFATSDRIVTIESWSRQEAKVWAVQENQIVIYRQSDFAKDELVMTKPISISQARAIKEAIEGMPRDAFGFHHIGGYSTHPPLLRLHFTSDGAWTARRIEASGQMPAFAKPLLDAVSAACPAEWRVDFADVAATYLRGLDELGPAPEIRKISIRDYYGEKPWWK